MVWVDLVAVLALFQFFVFGALVGRARGKYGVQAPATTGHALFERIYRVQMNTLELLVLFLPSLWLAAKYASPAWVAGIGSIYLLGRVVYLLAYTRDPASRTLGYALSSGPVVTLMLMALVGLLRAL